MHVVLGLGKTVECRRLFTGDKQQADRNLVDNLLANGKLVNLPTQAISLQLTHLGWTKSTI
jgi:hypothetical protein